MDDPTSILQQAILKTQTEQDEETKVEQ